MKLKKNKKIIKTKKSKKYTILKTILILILLLMLSIIGYFIYGTIKNGGGTKRISYHCNGTN